MNTNTNRNVAVVTRANGDTVTITLRDGFTDKQTDMLRSILDGSFLDSNGNSLANAVRTYSSFHLTHNDIVSTLDGTPDAKRSASAVYHTLNRKGVFSDGMHKAFTFIVRTAPVIIYDANADTLTTCDGCGASTARDWDDAMQGVFCNDCIKATDPAPVVVPVTYGDRHSCGYTYASRGHAALCG